MLGPTELGSSGAGKLLVWKRRAAKHVLLKPLVLGLSSLHRECRKILRKSSVLDEQILEKGINSESERSREWAIISPAHMASLNEIGR
ncbi:unnamed protein product, partial [Brenthis ino]